MNRSIKRTYVLTRGRVTKGSMFISWPLIKAPYWAVKTKSFPSHPGPIAVILVSSFWALTTVFYWSLSFQSGLFSSLHMTLNFSHAQKVSFSTPSQALALQYYWVAQCKETHSTLINTHIMLRHKTKSIWGAFLWLYSPSIYLARFHSTSSLPPASASLPSTPSPRPGLGSFYFSDFSFPSICPIPALNSKTSHGTPGFPWSFGPDLSQTTFTNEHTVITGNHTCWHINTDMNRWQVVRE
jgi:hypothetical protein